MSGPIFQHGKNAFLAVGYDIPGATLSALSAPMASTDTALITVGAGSLLATPDPMLANGGVWGMFINGVPVVTDSSPTSTTTLLSAMSAPSGAEVLPMINLSPFTNDISFPVDVEAAETTTFGNSGVKSYIVGLKGYTITFSGQYDSEAYGGQDGNAGGSDQIMNDIYDFQNIYGQFVSFIYGPSSPGVYTGVTPTSKYYGKAISTKYDVKSSVNGVVSFDGEFQITGAVVRTTL